MVCRANQKHKQTNKQEIPNQTKTKTWSLKELVYKPLPANLTQLKENIRAAFRDLPESMVARSVYGMKKRSRKLLKTSGETFEGKLIRL